jgi:hypothetical protein
LQHACSLPLSKVITVGTSCRVSKNTLRAIKIYWPVLHDELS